MMALWRLVSALALAATLATTASAATQTIDTRVALSDPKASLQGPFGIFPGATNRMGQVFTAPAPLLTGFSLFLTTPDPLGKGESSLLGELTGKPMSLQAFIFAWNGTGTTGGALFESELRTMPADPDWPGAVEFAFDLSADPLSLLAGELYVAMLSTAGLSGPEAVFAMPVTTDPHGAQPGSLVFRADSHGWVRQAGEDAWFTASFANDPAELPEALPAPVPVPAPATLPLLALGLTGLGLARRTSRRNSRL